METAYNMKRALITGITGQDGSYLAEFLLNMGYDVHGTVRRTDLEDPEHRMWRLRDTLDRINIHVASLESYTSLSNIISGVNPDELYHLAAQSFVSYSFEGESHTLNTNINGTYHLLSVLKQASPQCRVYFAGSSEMFGQAEEVPQTEKTPFHPRSCYGLSKVAGYHMIRHYRESLNAFAVSGILFNHESPRRGYEYVTRKISSHVARIKLNKERELRLGNLEARRDWGHAKDYVRAMWLMLQQDQPDDYVVSTGELHSVREFAEMAFAAVDLNYADYVLVDPNFYRPSEIKPLVGDPSKARSVLGWRSEYAFSALVEEMVHNDLVIEKEKGSKS